MEDNIPIKRAPGRPKGSKSTKPYTRQSFVYSEEQAKIIKYIKRKDKPMSLARFNTMTEKMEYLRLSVPSIPESRMRKIEGVFASRCYDHQIWIEEQERLNEEKRQKKEQEIEEKQNRKSAKKKEKERTEKEEKRKKDDYNLFKMLKMEEDNHIVIKDLTPHNTKGYSTTYISKKSVDTFQKRFHDINNAEQFMSSNLPGRLCIASRIAYEIWLIKHLRFKVDFKALARSLSRLYFLYYKRLASEGNERIARMMTEDDDVGQKFIHAIYDFYNLIPQDAHPVFSNKKQRFFDKVFDMDEWCYTFDFLYSDVIITKNVLLLTCIYHGDTTKHICENFACPKCLEEKERVFSVIQQKQQEESLKMRESFIEQATQVHGDRYDYSLVEYVNNNQPVKIRCKKHDYIFDMSPADHLNGRGCKKCAHNQKKTTKEYADELRGIYGDDYTLISEYKDSKSSVTCRCNIHNREFTRTSRNILLGWGCPDCMKEQGKKWKDVVSANYDKTKTSFRWTNEIFIKKAREKFGNKYDYSHVEYKNNDTQVCIVCNTCKTSNWITPDFHLRSKTGGCRSCYGSHTQMPEQRMKDFIKEANDVHNNRYLYLDKEYDKDNIHIYCNIHKDFYLNPSDHLKGLGCPNCFPNQSLRVGISVGERRITQHLKKKGIDFLYNKSIDNTYHISTRKSIRPDFQIPTHNAIIEFNGEQHYRFIEAIHTDHEIFIQQQLRDVELRRYCLDNNIRLLEIRFDEINNIPSLIDDFLSIQ